MAEPIKWPDTSAHGFVLNLLRTEHTTLTVIRDAGRLDAATRDALDHLGFEHAGDADADTGGQLRRPLAGLMVAALVKAFPRTVIRPHDREALFIDAPPVQPQRPADASTPTEAPSTSEAVPEAFEHNSTRIYPCRVRDADTGAITIYWAIESAANRVRRLAGERILGGDTLAKTSDEAKAIADRERIQEARDAEAASERAASALQIEAAEEARRRETQGLSLSEIKANDYLKSLVRDSETGETLTRRAWVERKVAQGLVPETTMVDKIKPMSRRQFNRATAAEQRLHEQRVKAGGKSTEYWLGDFKVTKTEYDLALRLLADARATSAALAELPGAVDEGVDDVATAVALDRYVPDDDEKGVGAEFARRFVVPKGMESATRWVQNGRTRAYDIVRNDVRDTVILRASVNYYRSERDGNEYSASPSIHVVPHGDVWRLEADRYGYGQRQILPYGPFAEMETACAVAEMAIRQSVLLDKFGTGTAFSFPSVIMAPEHATDASVTQMRMGALFVERERHHARPGSFTLTGLPAVGGDGVELVLGNVEQHLLPVLVGDAFADKLIREADEYPDGKHYGPIDIPLFPNGFTVPDDPVAAMATTIEAMGGAAREIPASSGEVFNLIRDRGIERIWTILEDKNGNAFVWPGFLGSKLTGATTYALSTRAWTRATLPSLYTASPALLAQAQQAVSTAEAPVDAALPGSSPARWMAEVARLVRAHEPPEDLRIAEHSRAREALARAIDRYDAEAIVDTIGWDTRASTYLRAVFRWASGMQGLAFDMPNDQPRLREQVSQWVAAQVDVRPYVLYAPENPEFEGGFWSDADGGRWTPYLSDATRFAKSQWQAMTMPHPKAEALLERDAEQVAANRAVALRDERGMEAAMMAFMERYGDKSPADGMFDTAEEAASEGASDRTWSIVEGEHGELWAVAGIRRVNVIGYIVTEYPWDADDDVGLYFPADADDPEGGPDNDAGNDADGDAPDADQDPVSLDGGASLVQARSPRMQGDVDSSREAARLSSQDIDGDDAELVADFEAWVDHASKGEGAAEPSPERGRGPRTAKRIEDFGEKIGGARKDLAASRSRGWMVADDIASWTDFELQTMVTKDSVWPAPDYRAMVAEGMPREVAFWIKRIRDKIFSDPYDGYANLQASAKNYVDTVGGLAERLSAVRTTADAVVVARHYASVSVELQKRLAWQDDPGQMHEVTRFQLTTAGCDVQAMMGRDVRRGGRVRRKQDYSSMALLMKDALDPFNKEPVPFCESGQLVGTKKWAGWPEAPKRAAKTATAETATDRDQVRPHLAHLQRVAPFGREGRDINEREFMATFGFRAGEFGNWLSAKDRQQVFNHAFDALSDLAHALDVPKDALSLGGSLAIAFGARGRGGKRAAAAHYEPGRHVINLTKIHGDGSLAHEWAHAFDAWIFSKLGTHLPSAASMPFLTERWAATTRSTRMENTPAASNACFGALVSLTRAEFQDCQPVVAAMDGVMKSMRTRTCTTEESGALWREKRAERENYLNGWLDWLQRNYLDALCIPKDQRSEDSVHPEVKAFADARRRYLGAHEWLDVNNACRDLIRMSVEDVRRYAAIQSRQSVIAKNLKNGVRVLEGQRDTIVRGNKAIADFERDPVAFAATSREVVWTTYAKDAQRRDDDRSSPYYTQPCELFARAFEAIVYDRLAEAGIRSDYLVHGVEDGAMRTEKYGSPYPCGDERVAMRKAFDAFIQALPVSEMSVTSAKASTRVTQHTLGM